MSAASEILAVVASLVANGAGATDSPQAVVPWTSEITGFLAGDGLTATRLETSAPAKIKLSFEWDAGFCGQPRRILATGLTVIAADSN